MNVPDLAANGHRKGTARDIGGDSSTSASTSVVHCFPQTELTLVFMFIRVVSILFMLNFEPPHCVSVNFMFLRMERGARFEIIASRKSSKQMAPLFCSTIEETRPTGLPSVDLTSYKELVSARQCCTSQVDPGSEQSSHRGHVK